jgi:protein-tyrosine phosphatase
MTWEQEVSVIVMLTLPVENGEEKCLQYYPEDEADVFGEDGFQVTLVEKTHDNSSDIRKLHVSHCGEQRTIWHFLFKAWPDHGIPLGSDQATLFSIMEISRAKNANQKARIVHCSAGVGRTGTFIALEHLLREMDRGAFDTKCDKDAVFETVNSLREQRMRMVNERQLTLIYQILRERWEERQASQIRDAEASQKRQRTI